MEHEDEANALAATKKTPLFLRPPALVWRSIDWKVVITSAVVAILIQGGPAGFKALEDALRDPPEVTLKHLSEITGDGSRVMSRRDVDLDGDGVNEVLATTVGTQGGLDRPAQTAVLIAAWDEETKRWGQVFSSSSFRVTRPDIERGYREEGFIPADTEVDGELELLTPLRAGGRDVVVAANLIRGRELRFVMIRLRFEGEVVKSVFEYSQLGEGHVTVVDQEQPGTPQLMRLTAEWQLFEHCCYTDTLFVADIAEDSPGHFLVVDDHRPMLGVVLALDERPQATVVRTLPGSPADGKLFPGDEIVGLPSLRPENEPGGPMNMLEELTAMTAGSALSMWVFPKEGESRRVEVTLAKRGSSSLHGFEAPLMPDLGMTLDAGAPGAFVESVREGSPASRAGIPKGAAVLRLGDHEIAYPADLWLALLSIASPEDGPPPTERAPLTYQLDPQREKTVEIDVGFMSGTADVTHEDWPPPLLVI